MGVSSVLRRLIERLSQERHSRLVADYVHILRVICGARVDWVGLEIEIQASSGGNEMWTWY